MSEDSELEKLKAKRLAEMQKNISAKQSPEEQPEQPTKKENPRKVLISNLGYRGMEVLQNAEFQFPNETKLVIQKLSELFASGEINEQIDGGKLLAIFRSIGLNIRMNTKIHVEQDGKFVSLSDKLGMDKSNDGA